MRTLVATTKSVMIRLPADLIYGAEMIIVVHIDEPSVSKGSRTDAVAETWTNREV